MLSSQMSDSRHPLGTLCLGFPLGSWFTDKRVAGLYSEAAACLWHRQQDAVDKEALGLVRPTDHRPTSRLIVER